MGASGEQVAWVPTMWHDWRNDPTTRRSRKRTLAQGERDGRHAAASPTGTPGTVFWSEAGVGLGRFRRLLEHVCVVLRRLTSFTGS